MTEVQILDTDLTKFNIPDAAIAKMASEYMPLKISDVNDAAGFKAVHEARMVVKNKRVEVEKVRKALKADALEYGRKVDSEAKRITGMLEPIESHLTAEEDAYNAEKERIKNAARLKAEAEARAKAEAEEAAQRAEQERIRKEQEAEAERLRIEREKIEAERAAIEAERRAAQDKIEAERRKIEADQKRLADIEAARVRAEEMEKAKAEAAERAKRETEERLAREAAEAKAKVEREAAEAAARVELEAAEKARIEAARPDGDKLRSVANEIASVVIPSMTTPDGDKAALSVRRVINVAAEDIREIVNQMYQ